MQKDQSKPKHPLPTILNIDQYSGHLVAEYSDSSIDTTSPLRLWQWLYFTKIGKTCLILFIILISYLIYWQLHNRDQSAIESRSVPAEQINTH